MAESVETLPSAETLRSQKRRVTPSPTPSTVTEDPVTTAVSTATAGSVPAEENTCVVAARASLVKFSRIALATNTCTCPMEKGGPGSTALFQAEALSGVSRARTRISEGPVTVSVEFVPVRIVLVHSPPPAGRCCSS